MDVLLPNETHDKECAPNQLALYLAAHLDLWTLLSEPGLCSVTLTIPPRPFFS